MKAISLRPEYAHLIALGWKNVECRTWKTEAPCDLLMVTSKHNYPYFPVGYAVGVIHVEKITEMKEDFLENAFMDEMLDKKAYAWHLTGYYPCKPFTVKGKLHIYEVPEQIEDLEFLTEEMSSGERQLTLYNWLKPLVKEMPDTLEKALQREEFADLFG